MSTNPELPARYGPEASTDKRPKSNACWIPGYRTVRPKNDDPQPSQNCERERERERKVDQVLEHDGAYSPNQGDYDKQKDSYVPDQYYTSRVPTYDFPGYSTGGYGSSTAQQLWPSPAGLPRYGSGYRSGPGIQYGSDPSRMANQPYHPRPRLHTGPPYGSGIPYQAPPAGPPPATSFQAPKPRFMETKITIRVGYILPDHFLYNHIIVQTLMFSHMAVGQVPTFWDIVKIFERNLKVVVDSEGINSWTYSDTDDLPARQDSDRTYCAVGSVHYFEPDHRFDLDKRVYPSEMCNLNALIDTVRPDGCLLFKLSDGRSRLNPIERGCHFTITEKSVDMVQERRYLDNSYPYDWKPAYTASSRSSSDDEANLCGFCVRPEHGTPGDRCFWDDHDDKTGPTDHDLSKSLVSSAWRDRDNQEQRSSDAVYKQSPVLWFPQTAVASQADSLTDSESDSESDSPPNPKIHPVPFPSPGASLSDSRSSRRASELGHRANPTDGNPDGEPAPTDEEPKDEPAPSDKKPTEGSGLTDGKHKDYPGLVVCPDCLVLEDPETGTLLLTFGDKKHVVYHPPSQFPEQTTDVLPEHPTDEPLDRPQDRPLSSGSGAGSGTSSSVGTGTGGGTSSSDRLGSSWIIEGGEFPNPFHNLSLGCSQQGSQNGDGHDDAT